MAKWTRDLDGELRHPDWAMNADGEYLPRGTRYSLDGDRILPNICLDGLTPAEAIRILQKL